MGNTKLIGGWALAVSMLALVGFAAFTIMGQKMTSKDSLHIGNGVFKVQTATTKDQWLQLIQNTSSIKESDALLRAFDDEKRRSLDVEGLKFRTDIIWLNKDKMVVDISPNISPDPKLRTVEPKAQVHFVISVSAGLVKQKNIKIGMPAHFGDAN